MEKLQFKTEISAKPEKVWNTLWDDASYRAWTRPFSEGSHAVTDWQEGSRVLFLDGKGSGMICEIARNIPNEYMSIRSLGEIVDGEENYDSERVRDWAGSYENYRLTLQGNSTLLEVEVDVSPEYKEWMESKWPEALAALQGMAEA